MKVPIMLFSSNSMKKIGRRFRPIGKIIMALMPSVGKKFSKMMTDVEPEEYATASVFSSLVYAIIFFVLSYALLVFRGGFADPLQGALLIGLTFWLIFLSLHLVYPSI